jgi:LDH2 family malate/lactate/ureidoglycolate dehydrogenase
MSKYYQANSVRKNLKEVLIKYKVKDEFADIVSKSLVKASLRGVHSHGVALINRYVNEIENGIIQPNLEPEFLIKKSDISIDCKLDNYKGFGQIGTILLIDELFKKINPNTSTISLTITNCNHIGDLKQYAKKFNSNNFSFLGLASAGANVGLKNGKKVGTNPFCLTIPVKIGDDEFIGCDLATSVFPEGKVRVAKMNKDKLPEDIIYDAQGNPSVDPNDLYDGGWLKPFGDYKGFAMASSIDLFLGYLGGSTNAISWDCGNNAQFFAKKSSMVNENLTVDRIKSYFQKDIPALKELESERLASQNGIVLDIETAILLNLNND